MTKRRDGLEIMRTHNPVDPARLDGPDSPRAQAMLSRIMASTEVEPPVPAPQRMGRTPAFAYSLLILLGIASVWLWTSPVTQPHAISCFAETSMNAHRIAAPPGGPATAEVCEELWSSGLLENPSVAPGTVPPLAVCVTPEGALAVFPTDDAGMCTQLGLVSPDSEGQDQLDSIRQLEADLLRLFPVGGCMAMEEANPLVLQTLEEAGFPDWSIQVHPGNPDRPCAGLGFDPASETVHLIPLPPPD